ncbi:hypothetical protein [Hymenobacter sp. IS2118]|uniref:hypothetical protein n=1 Tax=Hymenobacter sp. IS2118 TaxID=1505605 RepID=UPI0005559217|nr:hypothetical protein [Hymenobacter sp. IS2118]
MLLIIKRLSVFAVAGLLSLAGLTPAVGQTLPDSSRVSYGEEVVADSVTSKNSLRLRVEENSLWKLGLNDFNFITAAAGKRDPDYRRVGIHAIYERKLGPAWTVMGEVSPEFIRFRAPATGLLGSGLAVRSQLAGRYYYNIGRRLRKGKSQRDFSANYFSLALGSGWGRRTQETPYFSYAQGGPAMRLNAAVLYGLQRRLGRYGFVDANVGVPLQLTNRVPNLESPRFTVVHIVVLLRIGLALGR